MKKAVAEASGKLRLSTAVQPNCGHPETGRTALQVQVVELLMQGSPFPLNGPMLFLLDIEDILVCREFFHLITFFLFKLWCSLMSFNPI